MFFAVGALIQIILILWKKAWSLKFWLIVLFSFVFGISVAWSKWHWLDFGLSMSIFLMVLAMAGFYVQDLMSKITEEYIFVIIILFMYLIFANPFFDHIYYLPLYLFFLYLIVILVRKNKLHTYQKVFFYVMYLVFLWLIAYLQFPDVFRMLFDSNFRADIFWYDVIVRGMVFSIIVVNLFFLYNLLPIPQKHETSQDAKIRVRQHIDIVTNKFRQDQMNPFGGLIMWMLIVIVLVVNNIYTLMPDILLINIILFVYYNMTLWMYN